MDMQKEFPMTQSGYEQLQEELEQLKTVKRPEVVEKIKVQEVLETFPRTLNTMQLRMSKDLSSRRLQKLKKCSAMLKSLKKTTIKTKFSLETR